MTLKIWRGDAPAVAQVTHVVPDDVEIGDSFSLTINGKSITVIATAETAQNVVALFAAAIAESEIPEFQGLDVATVEGTLILTAAEPGVPFVVTGSAINGGGGGVAVTTTTQGAAAGSAVNAVIRFTVPRVGCGNAGTFTVYHEDNASSAIAVGASAATVQTALQAITSIGAGNVTVTLSTLSRDGIQLDSEQDHYTCTFGGALAGSDQRLVCELAATRPVTTRITRAVYSAVPGAGIPAEQQIDFGLTGTTFGGAGGSAKQFTLSYGGATTATQTMAAAGSLTSLLNGSFFGGGSGQFVADSAGDKITVRLIGSLLYLDGDLMLANNVAGCSGTYFCQVDIVTLGRAATAAVDEVQVITLTSGATGGTFTLEFSGQTTGTIAYNASAATVDAALEALSNIGAGDVVVTGSAGGPWTVTFAATKAAANQPQLTGNGGGLTGGAVQGITLTTVVASSGPNHWDTAANWLPSGVPITGDDVRFELGTSDCLYGLLQTGVTLATLHVAMSYRGKIGLPRFNADEYLEYRTFELSIGATSILLGHGEGSGSGKIALNTGAVQTAIVIRDSGGSADFGVPAITWRGTHVSNTLQMFGGEVGTAPYSDQTANLATLEQLGGSIALKHTAISGSLTVTSNHTAYDCTHAGQNYST